MDLGMSFLAPIRQQQIIDQQAQLAPVELAQKIGSNRLTNAHADYYEQQAQASKAKMEQDKQAAALMSQALGSGLIDSEDDATISEKLMRVAGVQAKAGQVTAAATTMNRASAAAAHEATERAAIVNQGLAEFKTAAARSKALAESLSMVDSQESLDRANAAYAAQFGSPSPLEGKTYDPDEVEQMRASALTTKQRADLAAKDAELKSKDANRRSAIQNRLANQELNERRLARAKEKATRDKKVGGKDVGSPTTAESAAAERLIQAAGLAEGVELETAAFDVAAQARALRKGNPGMTMDDALRQAFATKQEAGEFTPGNPGKIFGIGKVAPKYTPSPPVSPVPASKKLSDLVEGKLYRDDTGRVAKWTKNGWEIKKAAAKPAPSDGPDAEPDEDEDD